MAKVAGALIWRARHEDARLLATRSATHGFAAIWTTQRRTSPCAAATVYVYEAPVRLWHWVNALAIVVLIVTGYLIASPPAVVAGRGERAFPDGLHPLRPFRRRPGAGGRLCSRASTGPSSATTMRGRSSTCRSGSQVGSGRACCMKSAGTPSSESEPKKYVGHNPLAQIVDVLVLHAAA